MRLSVRDVSAIQPPAGKADYIVFDSEAPGLGLRIRDGGRTFVFQYRTAGGKQRRMSLGRATATTLDGARKAAAQLHARVVLGEDPAAERAEKRTTVALTFDCAVSRYMEWQRSRTRKDGNVGLKPRGLLEIERHLAEHARPFHASSLADVTRADVAALLGTISKERGPVASNRVRASISALFAWAITEGLTESNPVIGTRKNHEQERSRVLADYELAVVWDVLPANEQYTSIIRLLALTGQRKSEISDLRWSEIHDDVIELAPARTKNSRSHRVPLSAAAREIIRTQPRRTNIDGTPRDYVFGNGSRGFVGWSKAKVALDARIEALGHRIEPWCLHDLRRTCATRMADLGVQPHIVEAVLNHVGGHKSGVAGIYNRSAYEREKAAALDLWAAHLASIVAGEQPNVIPLQRGA